MQAYNPNLAKHICKATLKLALLLKELGDGSWIMSVKSLNRRVPALPLFFPSPPSLCRPLQVTRQS